ncbi:MAG: UbiA family prenyltransferase [Anaerolineae bacterium]|jgi:1,4-dihydroxy-2-naphthoate octaprenyltransferase|nr:UbiA family prenyltransferase [Anaerolineae bacterium]
MIELKSVITCDLEGRIETFNAGAVQVFGYQPEEVIGRKRVSFFSPGLTVLNHVSGWLKTAREQGEYRGRTVFLRRDGTSFAADVRITPTFRKGVQIGYCGVTVPRPDVPVSEAAQKISLTTRIFAWMVITRAPFLSATVVPILAGAAWVVASRRVEAFPWALFWLALVGGVAMHIAANTFNDYFDWKSGADPANNDYFMPYSGGSRSIELRLVSERGLLRVAWISLAIACLAGLPFLLLRGPLLLLFGAFGAFSVYFYTAPPLRLAARRGLGELIVGLNFGPLMTAGVVFALTGTISWLDFFVGLPIGLLTTAILWINQFPDMTSDAQSGKINLVVMLGKERARWGYLVLILTAYALVIAGVLLNLLPVAVLIALATVPLAVYAVGIVFRHYSERNLIKANSSTILVHLFYGLLLAAGLFLSAGAPRFFG